MPKPETVYAFHSKFRTVTLTVTFVALIALLIEGYINQSFDTAWFIILIGLSWNIVFNFIIKPRRPIPSVIPEVTSSATDESDQLQK